MAFRLKNSSLRMAIVHLCRFGDTDVLPHPPELFFLRDEADGIVEKLSQFDIDAYTPGSAIEALSPKGRLGFRIVHQLPILDTLLLLACVIEIGQDIELRRRPSNEMESFSYRFVTSDNGNLFLQHRGYKDWLDHQRQLIENDSSIFGIVATDISDFYARINYHRLENLIDECAYKHGAGRFIKKAIKVIRATQSFGLPVGGSAARILAELALSDTDQVLSDRNLIFTRYVDDFRIFLKNGQHAYDVLGLLAEHLGINEGLALNSSKTKIFSAEQYIKNLDDFEQSVITKTDSEAFESLTISAYFDDDVPEHVIDELRAFDLTTLLAEEIEKEYWDIHTIRIVFRALKATKSLDTISFIHEHLDKLVIFAKELCLLMQVIAEDNPGCFDILKSKIIELILSPPASSIQTIRTWLLEIFVRQIIQTNRRDLNKLDALNSALDRRQLSLLRGAAEDVNYFRSNKTQIDNFSTFQKPCVIWGASCLPPDEYDKWTSFAKSHMNGPLDSLYIAWANKNRLRLNTLLSSKLDDSQDQVN